MTRRSLWSHIRDAADMWWTDLYRWPRAFRDPICGCVLYGPKAKVLAAEMNCPEHGLHQALARPGEPNSTEPKIKAWDSVGESYSWGHGFLKAQNQETDR